MGIITIRLISCWTMTHQLDSRITCKFSDLHFLRNDFDE